MAASKPALRGAEKSPFHGKCRTRRAERLGDLDRAVGRARVDDDDLVDAVAARCEAVAAASPPRRATIMQSEMRISGAGRVVGAARAGAHAALDGLERSRDARRQRQDAGRAWRGCARRRCCPCRFSTAGSRRSAARRTRAASFGTLEAVERDAEVVEEHGLAAASPRGTAARARRARRRAAPSGRHPGRLASRRAGARRLRADPVRRDVVVPAREGAADGGGVGGVVDERELDERRRLGGLFPAMPARRGRRGRPRAGPRTSGRSGVTAACSPAARTIFRATSSPGASSSQIPRKGDGRA